MAVTSIATPARYQTDGIYSDIQVDEQGFQGAIEVSVGEEKHSEQARIPPFSMLRFVYKPKVKGRLVVSVNAGGKKGQACLDV